VELERVVRTEADVEAGAEKVRERVAFVREEEGIVRERRHGDLCARGESARTTQRLKGHLACSRDLYPDLLEVEQVLQRRDLAQKDAVRDRVGSEEGGSEVVGVAGFSRMRSKPERV
jgi:hypothetical protein